MRKQRKNKQDKTTGQKITGTLKAASATIAGVAFLRNTKASQRLISELFPAVNKTYNNIRGDLIRTPGRMKASDIEKAFDKHIGKGGAVFKQQLEVGRKTASKSIADFGKENKLFTSDSNQGIVGVLINRKSWLSENNKLFQHAIDERKRKLKNKNINAALKEQYKDKYDANTINQITESVYDDIEKAVRKSTKNGVDNYRISTKFKANLFKKLGIEENDRDNILALIYDQKKEINKELKTGTITKNADDKLDEILNSKEIYRSQTDKYLYNKLDKFLKKLGIDVDSEQLLTGSKAVRLKDLTEEDLKELEKINYSFSVDAKKKNKDNSFENIDSINVGEELRKLKNKKEDYGDLIIDKSLRKRVNADGTVDIFSTQSFDNYLKDKRKSFSSSILGKILYAGIDFETQLNKPFATMIKSGKVSAKATEALLEDSYLYLNGKAYKFYEDANGFTLDDGIEVNLISNNHGKSARINRNTMGTTRVSKNNSDDPLLKLFDIGQNGRKNIFKNIHDNLFGSEDEISEKEVIHRLKYTFKNSRYLASGMIPSIHDSGSELYEDIESMRRMLNYHISINELDDEGYQKLMDSLSENNPLKNIMSTILDDDLSIDDLFKHLNDNEQSLDEDGRLSALLKKYKKNPDSIHNYISIDSNPENTVPILDMPLATTNVRGPRQELRHAAIQEFILQNSYAQKANFYDALSDIDLTPRQRNLLDSIILDTNLNKILKSVSEETVDIYDDEAYQYMIRQIGSISNSSINKAMETIDSVSKDYNILNKGTMVRNEAFFTNDEYNPYDIINKSALPQTIANAFDVITNPGSKVTGQDLIEGINNTIKELTVGGRNDKEHYTMLTMMSQYSLQRLSMGVEEVGLGLSSDSMASPLDTFKNIALKRVLPAMIAYNTIDYLDFEARNLTGVSLTGAAANVLSDADLAARNIADHTGLGFLYDQFKNTSVIAEYLTGSTDYQNRDEREEWYKNGESVVRKARFWSFGSASEFRGTSISYYQPNYLRRAHSNWKEVGIYGDPDEKWKHSPLPSLRHPLSPIRFLLDPYWLEKKNFDTRPYPLTAKMFSEGTPWGAILNPTVGQLLKPVRMLPQARRQLKKGRVGEDINNVLYRINERIKRGESKDDDLLIVTGTDIRNAEYMPFSHPTSEEYNITNNQAQGLDYMDSTLEISDYVAPSGEVYLDNKNQYNTSGKAKTTEYKSLARKEFEEYSSELLKNSDSNIGQNLIGNINRAIKGDAIPRKRSIASMIKSVTKNEKPYSEIQRENAFDRFQTNMPDEGVYIYKNLIRDKKKADEQYYENKENPKRIDRSIYKDLLRDVGYSAKQLSGIYGFLGDSGFGSDYKKFRFENAGQMASFTRGFWDSSVGGLGGGVMEISRRFFPSTNKDVINVNPLKNEMAAWLPASYRTGDPFVKIPKGEMRLPGKGYETLHELHPDQFATDGYGAFDRFKILADIAPYSDEYKTWRGIAKRTVTDPDLVSQMEEIEKRVKKKSGDHEFFEYKYINNNTKVEKGVVKNVGQDGTIELQSGLVLDLAGLKPIEDPEKQQQQTQSIYDFIKPGDKINYQTTENPIKNLNDMTEKTKAVIYKEDSIPFSTTNVSKELIDAGIMEYDEEDKSPVAALAKTGTLGETLGGVQELIAHAPIPFLHNKFMKVETALESFQNEQVYGSNFQTWDHPIEGFVKPAFNKSFAQSMPERAVATAMAVYHFGSNLDNVSGAKRFMSGAILSTLDPTAFFFGGLNWAFRLNNGDNRTSTGSTGHIGKARGAFDKGAQFGSIVSTVGWGIVNAKNPVTAATSFGLAALSASEYLDDTTEVLERRLPKEILNNKFFKGEVTPLKIAAIGATIGLTVSAVRNITSPEEEMFGKWIPKKTRRKYELDEYFDRLNYIKNQGLYKKAARLAASKEGSNIGYLFDQIDKNKKKVGELKKKALELSNKHMVGSYEYEEKMTDIKNHIAALEEKQQIAFNAGGKYTKAAVAYKKAAESTIYGLNEGSSNDEIMAAVPTQYKDYFMSFINESDEKKRKEILSYMPEYLQKPLQIAWGQDYEVRSNARYFKKKRLPNMSWKGWKPNVNMDHVKMKTIESEGMLLSDFGYYESEKSKAQYDRAEALKPSKRHSSISVRGKLMSIMQGMGMPLTNISVEETSSPGISILGDFQQQAQDVASLASYI